MSNETNFVTSKTQNCSKQLPKHFTLPFELKHFTIPFTLKQYCTELKHYIYIKDTGFTILFIRTNRFCAVIISFYYPQTGLISISIQNPVIFFSFVPIDVVFTCGVKKSDFQKC